MRRLPAQAAQAARPPGGAPRNQGSPLPPRTAEDTAHAARSWNLGSGLLTLLAICLVPAVVGAALYLQHLRDTALRDAYGAADLVATGTSESLRWLLQDAEAMLASVAARPQVRAADPAACDPILAEFRAISPAFKTLSLRLADGRSLCSELQHPPAQQSVAAAPWFQAALRQPGLHVSDGHPGTVEQGWTVRLTYPVADATGRLNALLITPMDLRQLQQRLFARLRPDALVAVVDAANRVVVRSAQQDERMGKPAAPGVARIIDALRHATPGDGSQAPGTRQFAEEGIDGVRRLFVIRQVPLSNWVVVSGVAEDLTLQGYRQARNRSLLVFLAVLVFASLTAWRVSRGIRRPVRALAEAARALSRGDPPARVPEAGPTETRLVAREFNNMVVATALAREHLQASELRYRTLLQNLPVAVMSHASDGSVELFNDRACALLRLTPEQLQGSAADAPAWHFVNAQGHRVPPQDHPAARVLRSLQALPPTTYGVVGAGAPAPHAWVMVTGYPQLGHDGRVLQAVVAFVDISVQHNTEQLRLAKESAEAASKAKSDFLSRLSHELRTPLNAISGFSQLMLMDPQLQAHHRARLGHVVDAGDHLLLLINQILDISSLESGQQHVSTRAVPLAPLLQSCAAACSLQAQAMAVELRVLQPMAGLADPARLSVQADPSQLRLVLMNLLSNAIRYNRPRGSVQVAVRRDGAGGSGPDVQLDITDTGIGLDAVQLERLFEPFNRVGAERTLVEGHGIGLAHARALARSMGGDITVTSQPGLGSCFTLHLRSAPAQGQNGASPPTVP
jgi:signal transduction histidine kinase